MGLDVTVRRIAEMEGAFGGSLKRVRAELGVSSFGLAVLDLPPDVTRYPEHDHRGDRQEEVYVVLAGSGEIEVAGERQALDPETMVRVGPAARRRIVAGGDGLRLLALGGVPGERYDPPELSKPGNLPLIGSD